jgi:hypothetical protein
MKFLAKDHDGGFLIQVTKYEVEKLVKGIPATVGQYYEINDVYDGVRIIKNHSGELKSRGNELIKLGNSLIEAANTFPDCLEAKVKVAVERKTR